MNDYKESCVLYKKIRQGIIEQRPIPNSKNKTVKKNWLAVYWDSRKNKFVIWKDYTSEELANKQTIKMLSYWPMYVVKKEIYEKHYNYIYNILKK